MLRNINVSWTRAGELQFIKRHGKERKGIILDGSMWVNRKDAGGHFQHSLLFGEHGGGAGVLGVVAVFSL